MFMDIAKFLNIIPELFVYISFFGLSDIFISNKDLNFKIIYYITLLIIGSSIIIFKKR